MPLIPIRDLDDPRIAPYSDLQNRRAPSRRGKFIAEGELVVRRLLASRYAVESLLVTENHVHRLDVPDDVPVFTAPLRAIEAIAGFRFHRGMLGCGIRPPRREMAEAVRDCHRATTIVVCAGIRDAENLGVLLRNCAAFGVELVVLGDHSADPLSRRVLRVSMATVLQLNVCVSPDLCRDVAWLRERFGIQFVATVLDPRAPGLAEARRPDRLGLVFGNELDGVSGRLMQLCDRQLTMPMRMGTDSVNVAVAAGIFLYHFSQGLNE